MNDEPWELYLAQVVLKYNLGMIPVAVYVPQGCEDRVSFIAEQHVKVVLDTLRKNAEMESKHED